MYWVLKLHKAWIKSGLSSQNTSKYEGLGTFWLGWEEWRRQGRGKLLAVPNLSKSGFWFWRGVCQGWSHGRCPHTLEKLSDSSGNWWKPVFPGILSSCDLAKAACGRQGPCASSEWERSDFYKAQHLIPGNAPKHTDWLPFVWRCILLPCAAHACTDVWDF